MSNLVSEKGDFTHREHASEKDVPLHVEHHIDPLRLHEETLIRDVTAAQLADETLYVDQRRADELRRELATNSQGGYRPVTEEEKAAHRRLNRKFDLYILPFCSMIYMFNQLDRSNLGNAQTNGFSDNIGIPSSTVNVATSIFFAAYVPLMPFLAALGKRVGVTYFICVVCTLWGILSIAQAFIKTGPQLIALRVLVALAESGFYPSVLSYMSLFYPRYDCAFRFALFYGFYSVAGAFGGLIAFGIFQVHGALWSWQYLFLLEGSVPVLLGIIAPFFLARDARSAWYLTPEERDYAEKRMVIDAANNLDGTYKVTLRDFKEGFLEWRVYLAFLAGCASGTASQGFTIFFPVVVKGLGYSGALANLMTVPPYVCGALGVWGMAYSSDRHKERTFHVLGGISCVMIGLIMTITIPLSNIGGRYAGLLILIMGTFVSSPIVSAWLAGNTPEPGKRVLMLSINGISNISGVWGSIMFQAKYGPNYKYPLTVTLILMAVAWVLFAIKSILLRLTNRSRAKKLATMTIEQIEEENRSDVRVGDKKYTFVYGT